MYSRKISKKRILVGIGIIISCVRSRLSTNDAVEHPRDLGLRTWTNLMTEKYTAKTFSPEAASCANEAAVLVRTITPAINKARMFRSFFFV